MKSKILLKLILKKISKNKKILFSLIFFLLLSFLIFGYFYFSNLKKENKDTFHEVIIGEKAVFINPILAKSKTDKSLVKLIFSPLLKKNSRGEILPNLVEYKIDKSGKKYNLKMKEGFFWQDRKKITIDDVLFTLLKIKNPDLKEVSVSPPLQPYFIDAKFKKINSQELEITIPNENYYFLDYLSEVYILPKHIWEKLKNSYTNSENLAPTGSGKFFVSELAWEDEKKMKNLEKIILQINPQKAKNSKIKKIIFEFFKNFDEFYNSELYKNRDKKNINLFYSEKIKKLENDFQENEINEAVSFNFIIKNGNKNKFLKNYKIRKYLTKIWNSSDPAEISEFKKELLKDNNFSWDSENKLLRFKNELINFSVIVGENKDNFLLKLAKKLQTKFRNYGIDMNILVVDDVNYYTHLMNRDYESIISGFKEDEKNLIYYYHSSQKEFPGVNVGEFNSEKIDKILLALRENINEENRKKLLSKLKEEIKSYYTILKLTQKKSYYYTNRKIKNLKLNKIKKATDRFENIFNWEIQN